MGDVILGNGTDIVEVERIARLIEKFGNHFERKVFTEREVGYCRGTAKPAMHFAARFAAKEAVSKAFGTGIGSEMSWKEIEIVRGGNGKPTVVLHDSASKHAAGLGPRIDVIISLSHTDTVAVAYALLISRGPD